MYGCHFVAKRVMSVDCAESVQFALVYGETALDGLDELRLICGATFCSQFGCQDCHVDQLYRYVDDVVGTGDARTAVAMANSSVGVRIFDLEKLDEGNSRLYTFCS
jgi:hypothetical protein